MKRSQVNAALRWAEALLEEHGWCLPEMAGWSMKDWKAHRDAIDTVKKVMLGWDITDFGTGDFDRWGAVLYTVRNGLVTDASVGVPYCEKLILMKEGQQLPEHYHVFKTEDIVNRGGGVLEVFLWNADKDGNQLDTDVHVSMDGIPKVFHAGEPIRVLPGNSISLTPYLAHIFGPEKGTKSLIVGEVSKVNDDKTDNYFLQPTSRFAAIEEDEAPIHPLCNELDQF